MDGSTGDGNNVFLKMTGVANKSINQLEGVGDTDESINCHNFVRRLSGVYQRKNKKRRE